MRALKLIGLKQHLAHTSKRLIKIFQVHPLLKKREGILIKKS